MKAMLNFIKKLFKKKETKNPFKDFKYPIIKK
jgi:hypothetical protein